MNPNLKRNFALFPVLDWIAEITATFPIKENSWSVTMAPAVTLQGEREKRRKPKKNRPRSRKSPPLHRRFLYGFHALVVVTIPVFFPIVEKLGFDSIWFGVIVVLVAEMGVITPPVGVNVFVLKGIAPEVPLGSIFKGIFPFLVALIIVTFMLVIFPRITTLLPNLVS